MRGGTAREYLTRLGRPFVLRQCPLELVSVTGDKMAIEGELEVHVPQVGVVKFIVVKTMAHEAILGWDMMSLYGCEINAGQHILKWGQAYFSTDTTSHGSEVAGIDAGFLTEVVNRHSRVFGELGSLPQADLPAVSMITEPGKVVAQKPYRTALNKRQIIDEEVDKMLRLGIIRPSQSPWASPVTLVPKKDATARFCIDYRQVNSITEKDRYPLPLIQDIFDQLGGSSIFSTLDMRSGYWQLPMAEDSIAKTAFVCHRGQFEFLRLPFGLANAPSVYQRAMSKVLADFLGKFVMVFIDDIVIYSRSEEEHKVHVEQVLTALEAARLTLKDTKCFWGQTKIDLLGYVVTGQGVSAQPRKTEAIRSLQTPTDLTELRRFLGMTGYYRQLIPDYARIAAPLYGLCKKGTVWYWDADLNAAFETLKLGLCDETCMAHPKVNDPYILYTDACGYALGGILCQLDEQGLERPIQYLSAKFTEGQVKWATIEKEAYAVIYCLKKLRAYLLGSQFVVYTDHKPLLSLFTKEMVNTRIQRWAVLLAEFGAVIKYREGKNNVRADMLSRIKEPPEIAVFEAAEEWVTIDDPDDHAFLPSETQIGGDEEVRVAQAVEFPDEKATLGQPDSKFLEYQGLLYSIGRPDQSAAAYPRLMVPQAFRESIVNKAHQDSGHAGLVKTLSRIQEDFVWPGMRKEVTTYLGQCGQCVVNKSRPVHVEMGEMPIATGPGQIVGIDLMGPLFRSSLSGAAYLCVIIDHYSGWVEAYPLANKSNEAVWERLTNDYVPRHGAPRLMISDQGSEFRGAGFQEWLEVNHIEHRRTSGYNPQSNGKTERMNGTIRRMLERLCNGNRAAWEDQLGPALTAIRTNISTVTGFSPFVLHHARDVRHTVGRMVNGAPDPTWSDRLRQQNLTMTAAAKATAASRVHNRDRLAAKANAGVIEPGDQVLIKGTRLTPLTAKWDHHYRVTRVQGKVITVLHEPTGKTSTWNRNKIRLVDSEICWDGVGSRPKAQNIPGEYMPSTFRDCRLPTPAQPDDPQPQENLLYPQPDEQEPLQPPPPRRKRIANTPADPDEPPSRRRRERPLFGAPDPRINPRTRTADEPLAAPAKRPRWQEEQMDILSFAYCYFSSK